LNPRIHFFRLSEENGGAMATATTLSRTSGGKEVNITTSVVSSKDSSMGNGSIVGTTDRRNVGPTAPDYFGSPVQQSGGWFKYFIEKNLSILTVKTKAVTQDNEGR
jgi:hypothetical protein